MTNYTNLKDLSDNCLNKEIHTFGRIHKIRSMGKRCFVVLRDQIWSIQCVANKGDNKFKEICKLVPESFIIIKGIISKLPDNVPKVEYTYHKNFELKIIDIELISKSKPDFPFALEDVNEMYANKDRNKVLLHTRLNNRPFDLRAPFNNCIFKIQSGVSQLFRDYLVQKDFMEVQSPKLIGTASEGGAAVFQVDYFGTPVYLAQSPQLYKQMCINSDFNRVFEIGPIFRAENCISHRHLCEFTGLDIEMALTPGHNYHEIIEILWNTLNHIFNNLKIICKEQLAYIKLHHNYDDVIYPTDPLIIDFKEGVRLLREYGVNQNEFDDLSSQNEKKLGEIVKEKFNSDLFVLDKYPANVRPFYTMRSTDSKYSNSYDVILRGQEISSGSQRIHNLDDLVSRMTELGINTANLTDYLESFEYGSRPHGGAGLGLNRVVMLYLDLENIRETSLYPRDPGRVTP